MRPIVRSRSTANVRVTVTPGASVAFTGNSVTGVSTARMVLNKRLTGWVNLKLNRGHTHRSSVVEAMMDDLRERRVDHVVITGDVSNLALEPEFEKALGFIERMGYAPTDVSVIPGNHDLYTQGAQKSRRFARFFAPYMTCDLDVASHDAHPSGRFPYVRLRGPVAILGVSTAVARLPLVASGVAGAKQIDTLRRMRPIGEYPVTPSNPSPGT